MIHVKHEVAHAESDSRETRSPHVQCRDVLFHVKQDVIDPTLNASGFRFDE
jgi:hypothetical protein